jgi:hypothetical protein
MLPDKKIKCPYTGFAKSCFDGVTKHNCPKWVHLMGANPQTGEHIDKYACSDSMIHLLLLENSRMQRQTGAAIESFRNEMIELNQGIPNGRRLA